MMTHYRTCYPNLREAANAAKVEARRKNPDLYRQLHKKYDEKIRNNEELAQMKGTGEENMFSCSYCDKLYATISARNQCETKCKW